MRSTKKIDKDGVYGWHRMATKQGELLSGHGEDYDQRDVTCYACDLSP
jgi:hypothetical protein